VTAVLAALLPHLAIRLFEAIVPPPPGSRPRLRRAALLLSLPVGLVVASPYYGHGYARGLVFFYAFGLLGAALWALAARGQTSPSRATKGRVRYLVVVGAFATAFNLFDFLWFIGAELPPFGSVLSVIFLFALAESLERERLLDLYELLGRLFVNTALAFALAGIFYLCVTVIGRFNTMYLNAVLGAVVILVLFEPLRSKVEEKIHQIFFRERFDLERAVGGAKRALAHALEADDMCRVVLSELEASRRATGAALYLRDSEGRGFERAGFFGPPPPERLELSAVAALCELVARRGSVRLEEAAGEAGPGEGHDIGLLRAAAGLLGPLREGAVIGSRDEGGELLALLVVADDRVRDAFSPEELALLETLAAQIGVVLENTHIYARLKTRDRLAALGQMAAGLAHEIKNPLGAIKGAAQLLVDPTPDAPALDPHASEFVGIILEEVERLDRVVRSVLDYARPSTAPDEATDVNAVVRRTAQILAPPDVDDYRVELALGEGLPRALIDAEKLRQVLINLVQNAVQAMGGRGSVRVSSRLRPTRPAWASRTSADGGSWVEVAVSDQGPGISKHVLKNLFVPFFTTKDRGTGLGLAISQHIAQTAGGHIEVSTVEGSGTTFSVLLPAAGLPAEPLLARPEPAADSRAEPAAEARAAGGAP
jgi:two-component system, NtrC family, sensor histidine kinase HydH